LLSDDIPSMAEVLESFDPYYTCPAYCFEEDVDPPASS